MLRQALKAGIKLTTLGLPCGHHMTRYRMYHDISQSLALDKVDRTKLGNKVVAISGSGDLCRAMGVHAHHDLTHAVYPHENVLGLTYPSESFDYYVSDQVLEHVGGSPQQVADETHRVLKPGGIAVVTTCGLQELHGLPHDYWRFSPAGLRHLFRGFSEIIACDSWGNRLAFLAFRYFPVPHAKWHPLHKIAMLNEPIMPMVTWIIARK